MSASMFPARAGMSRDSSPAVLGMVNVPRASGDEPLFDSIVQAAISCSPRERG